MKTSETTTTKAGKRKRRGERRWKYEVKSSSGSNPNTRSAFERVRHVLYFLMSARIDCVSRFDMQFTQLWKALVLPLYF